MTKIRSEDDSQIDDRRPKIGSRQWSLHYNPDGTRKNSPDEEPPVWRSRNHATPRSLKLPPPVIYPKNSTGFSLPEKPTNKWEIYGREKTKREALAKAAKAKRLKG